MGDPAQLYEADFFRWTQEQAALLRQAPSERINLPVDWLHAAEEIEDMGRRDLRAVHSRVRLIPEHLLRLKHSPVEQPRDGWIDTIDRYRDGIAEMPDDSPSIRGELADGWNKDHERARRKALKGLARAGVSPQDVPVAPACIIDEALDPEWWPASRHGCAT